MDKVLVQMVFNVSTFKLSFPFSVFTDGAIQLYGTLVRPTSSSENVT